jgi:DNA-binding beta-propeller fold protein YncE
MDGTERQPTTPATTPTRPRTTSNDEPDAWPPPASVQQKIEDQIRCPVCCEIYREPRALPCFHIYCLQCLQSAANRLRPGDDLACPQCRKTVEIPATGVSGLQVAFHVNNLIEIYGSIQNAFVPVIGSPTTATTANPRCANCGPGSVAGFFCPKCNEFLCGMCGTVHGKWTKFSGHELSAISEEMLSRHESSCKTHPSQLLTHYCKMCKQLICIDCLQESSNDCTHRQRKVSITEASHQAKDAILASLKPIRSQLASIEGVGEQIQAKKQHISEQATEVNSRIYRDIEGLKGALELRRSELKEAVKAEEERKYLGLRGQEEDAEIAKNQLSNYLGGVNQCLQRGSNVQVVKLQQVVEEKVREILQEFSSMPQAPVEAANLRYFSSGELSASIPPFGLVCSSSIAAADFYVSVDSPHWATACDETNVTIVYTGAGTTSGLLDQLKIELSSEDSSNPALFEIQREVSSNQVVVHYIPITKGRKKLHVTLFGHEISGSPLDLSVMGPFRFTGTLVRCVREFRRPWGVSVSQDGQMVVVDNQGWHALHLYKEDGTQACTFTSVAIVQTPEILIADDVCNEPRGVAFTKDGNILLVDGKRHRVLCYSTDGTLVSKTGSYGKGKLQFNDPVGIAVGPFGQILVCDRRNHRIHVLTPDLQFIRQIGKFGEGDFWAGPGLYLPWDVACDSKGDVYVADCGHCCVKVFSSKGQFLRAIGGEGNQRGQFKHISSICIDSNDYLYALDKERACVSVFNPRGDLKMQFGTIGAADGQFLKPLGIAVDRNGRIYVTDGESSVWPTPEEGRVQVFE